MSDKKYFWSSKEKRNFNEFVEDVENDKYFKEDEDTEPEEDSVDEGVDYDLKYGIMIDYLEKENKSLWETNDKLKKELEELEVIRKNQILIIKNLETKLLESNSNLEGYYPKKE